MKKVLQILLIGFLILSCNNKNRTESKTFGEMEIKDYSEEERKKEFEYLKTNVFNGLENLNDGFDSESIYYFSESDFEIAVGVVRNI